MFCGENKVKRFFSGLTYFLLLGATEDMVTNYKEMMNGKREIPISSCPPQIEDLVYGTGSVLHSSSEENEAAFQNLIAEPVTPPKKGRKKVVNEREQKLRQIRKECGQNAVFTYRTVDTSNRFRYLGDLYEIAESVEAYAPKETPLGLLYDMDKIVCVDGGNGVRFYTMTYDPIEESQVLKIS